MPVSHVLTARIEASLDELMAELSGALAAVVATSDGFEVASRSRSDIAVGKLAAMACSISAVGVMAGQEGGIGIGQSVIVEAPGGFSIIIEIAHPQSPMVLNLLTTRSEALGQVLFRAKRVAHGLAQA